MATYRIVYFAAPDTCGGLAPEGFQPIAQIIEFDLHHEEDALFEITAMCQGYWPSDAVTACLERH